HVHELYVTVGGKWTHANLTGRAEASPAVGSALSGYEWAAGNSKQVAYIDSVGDVQELYVIPGAQWSQENRSANAGAEQAAIGPALSGFQAANSAIVLYLDSTSLGHWLTMTERTKRS
ncbi:hypothetical protein, partial [Streptomyces sp. NPDC046197]|uniref:hypothetical protein n=1 Tax=Streptomyces sp. NPDC046197 TaxID=3154337 RepID=UPI00340E85B1